MPSGSWPVGVRSSGTSSTPRMRDREAWAIWTWSTQNMSWPTGLRSSMEYRATVVIASRVA